MEGKDEEWPSRAAARRAMKAADALQRFQSSVTLAQLVFVDDTASVIDRSSAFRGEREREEARDYARASRVGSGREQHASIVAATADMRELSEGVLHGAAAPAYDAAQLVLAGALGEARGRAIGAMAAAWDRLRLELDGAVGEEGFAEACVAAGGPGEDPLSPAALAPRVAAALGGPAGFYRALLLDAAESGRRGGEARMRARGGRAP